MKTKLLYVLVSSDNDLYLEQAFVSMYSAKYYMPDAHITLLVDSETNKSFDNPKRKNFLCYTDELIYIDIDSKYTPIQRSRILKTSARKYVKGDFLFLDTDTILTGTLYEIDNFQFNLGAVSDLHQYFDVHFTKNMLLKELKKGFNYKPSNVKYYFNSGVFFAKDNESVHYFYDKWNSLWIEGASKGLYRDQPSLLITNETLGHPIVEMDGIYNCQLSMSLKYFPKSKILHYFNMYKSRISHVFTKEFLYTVKYTGCINENLKSQIINCKNSFRTPSIIITDDDAVVYNDGIFYEIVDVYRCNKTAYKILNLIVHLYRLLVKLLYVSLGYIFIIQYLGDF